MESGVQQKHRDLLEELLHLYDEKSEASLQEHSRRTLEVMYQSRFMDDKMNILVRQNKGGTFHMNALGHELI